MKQNLLNKLWLRVCMIVAIMTTALSGTAWAETATWAGTTALPGTATSIGNSPITIMVSATNTYTNPIRVYANTTITIAATTGYVIQSVAYEASSTGNYVTYAQNATVTPNVTPTVSGKIVTWALSNASEFTFTPSAQTRANGITVTYTSAGGTPTVATPVINGTENFLTSAEVSISCATDGATILYNTGGEAWETYSAPFTVTETTTVKAKATKTSMDDSEVATKTFTKVTALTVAEARAAIDAGVGVEGVYATGIVSAIPTAYNAGFKNITFNFVDAAGDTDFLQAYRCTGALAEEVQVGDVVVVYGNLTKYGTTYEFGQGCELVSLTHPTAAVEAPIFSPEGGVYTTPQSVSFAVAAPTMEGYTFYYTLDGTEPTTQSTLYTGPIEVSTTTTIKAIAVKGGEVSLVTTATYAILAHAGTEADPYSVADAHAAIDANAGLTDVYATGVVTEIATAWSTEHSNISFNFVDAAGDGGSFLQAYRCVSTDAADASTVAVGDIVVVKGTLKLYGATYEFGAGCQLVSLTHSGTPADPVIVAENATIDADVTYYELMYEIQNPVDGTELTASTTASWITSLTPSTKSFDRVMIVCEANETTTARTATIVLTYGNVTKEVTLTQKGIVAPITQFASLPFSFDGGNADIESTEGLTQDGLGADYNASPKLRFDGTGDYLLLAFDERPGVLTFDIKGNSFSGGTFKVMASEDGEEYGTVATYTELGSVETKTITDLGEDIRYIKWVYTEKVTGNVALGNINLAKYSTETAIVAEDATIDADVTYYELIYEIQNPVDGTELLARTDANWITSITPSQKSFDRVMIECEANNTDADRTATITLVYGNYVKEVTLTQKANIVLEPVITAADVTLAYDATEGTIEYSVENPRPNTEMSASTEAEWITNIQTPSSAAIVTFSTTTNESTEARTATVTLAYGNYTKNVTVTQEGYEAPVADYAELPFTWEGGVKSELLAEAGVTAEGLGSDYAESNAPYRVKLDTTGDYIQVKTNERPGIVTIGVKMVGGANASSITVQESADGENFTDVEELSISGAQNDVLSLSTTTDFAETSRYIRLSFTKGSNVGVGYISIAKYEEPAPALYVRPNEIAATADGATGTLTITAEGITLTPNDQLYIEFHDADGGPLPAAPDWITTEVTTGEAGFVVNYTIAANQGEARSTFFQVVAAEYKLFSNAVTVSQEAYTAPATGDQYKLYYGDLVEGDYIIYYDGKAMSNEVANNRLQYAEVTPENDIITTDNEAIVWHIAPSGEYWTIYSPAAKAYAASNGTKNQAQMLVDADDHALWSVEAMATHVAHEFTNKANAAADVNAVLRNNGTYGFACYSVNTGGAVQLYKKVESFVPTVQTVTVTDAGYATFVAEKNLEIPTDVQVEVFAVTVEGSYASLQPIMGNIPAGEAVLVKASAGDYNFLSAQTADPIRVNKLVAATTDVVADGTQYVLANGASGIGFYQATSGSTIPAGKAYLVVTAAGVKPFYGFEDDATGIEMVNGQSSMVNDPIFKQGSTIVNLAGQRLQKMQRGINIIGGKKVLK